MLNFLVNILKQKEIGEYDFNNVSDVQNLKYHFNKYRYRQVKISLTLILQYLWESSV